ncbi:hypothetical protein HK098_002998 [Nowakowskiella sp. JEL0407]|nr:hypothetical protein HK098_002998 [Nowakowskiella sp. JEL0407]
MTGDQALKLEKTMKDGIIATEFDKIHGIDPALYSKRDTKISRYVTTTAPPQPANMQMKGNLEALENRLILLETQERARSIDIRVIMETLQQFQIDMMKKIDVLEKKVEEGVTKLDAKCDRMEKVVAKFSR